MNPSFHFNDGLVYWSPKNLWKGFFHPHNGNLISPSPTLLATYLPPMKSSLDYGSMWIACWQALLLGTKGQVISNVIVFPYKRKFILFRLYTKRMISILTFQGPRVNPVPVQCCQAFAP